MIKEVKKEKEHQAPPPKKRHLLLRFVIFLVTAVLVLGAIFLVVNRDKLNFDALKRWFAYRTLAQSDTTNGGEPFTYQGSGQMSLLDLNGDLLSVSETGVRLYSPGGTAYVEDTVTLGHPACHVAGNAAVVYDAGGAFLRVYRDRRQVFDLEGDEATVLSARLNAGGYLSVVTRSNGYKGVVTVYNSSFDPVIRLNLSSSFVLDSLVAPDNRSVAVVTAGQENRFFSAKLAQYSFTDLDEENPTPVATLDLGNQLPLDLAWDGGGVRVMSEYGAVSADGSLVRSGGADWSDRYLKRYSLLADDSYVVLTGKYRAGSQTRLEVLDRTGAVQAALDVGQPILSLSAAGKYIAVLTAGELTIYTHDLTPYATVENTQGASHTAALPDGSAYLATEDAAWLYLPN